MACGKTSLGFLCFMLVICKALNHCALDSSWGKRLNRGETLISQCNLQNIRKNHRDFLVAQVGVFCSSCSWTYQSGKREDWYL